MIPFSRPQQWLYLEGSCHELGHTWSTSCIYSAVDVFLCVLWEGFKIYLPLYLASDLLRRSSLKSVIYNTLPNVIRSTIFLGVNGGGFVAFICLVRRLLGRFYFLSTAYIPAACASLCAISIERKSRRGLLMGYVSTIAVELIYTIFKSRGYVSSLPYGEVLIFCAASAVLMHRHRTQKANDAVGLLLRALFTPTIPSSIVKYFKSTPVNNRLTAALITGLWGFMLGYLGQTAINLISRSKKILTERGKALKKILLNPHSIKFGMFLATLMAGFKLINTLLYHSSLPRDVRLLLAGLVAGMAMLFLRSSTLSLYAAGKALEVLFFKAVQRGWLKSWYYGDMLLYVLSTATIFHGAFFESHNLRPGYNYFLKSITRGRIEWINYEVIDFFGTQASKRQKQIKNQQR